jgi:hypothetical protein
MMSSLPSVKNEPISVNEFDESLCCQPSKLAKSWFGNAGQLIGENLVLIHWNRVKIAYRIIIKIYYGPPSLYRAKFWTAETFIPTTWPTCSKGWPP